MSGVVLNCLTLTVSVLEEDQHERQQALYSMIALRENQGACSWFQIRQPSRLQSSSQEEAMSGENSSQKNYAKILSRSLANKITGKVWQLARALNCCAGLLHIFLWKQPSDFCGGIYFFMKMTEQNPKEHHLLSYCFYTCGAMNIKTRSIECFP